MSKKKQRQTIDACVAVVVVLRESERERWLVAARRSGLPVGQWVRDRMNRIAPEEL